MFPGFRFLLGGDEVKGGDGDYKSKIYLIFYFQPAKLNRLTAGDENISLNVAHILSWKEVSHPKTNQTRNHPKDSAAMLSSY